MMVRLGLLKFEGPGRDIESILCKILALEID